MARVKRKDLKRRRRTRKFLDSEEGQRIIDAVIASLVGDPVFDRVRKRAEDADKGIYPKFDRELKRCENPKKSPGGENATVQRLCTGRR